MGDKSFDGDIPQDVIDEDILHANDPEAIVTLFSFGHLVRFLSSKKRGEFPTTMQIADKKTAIAADLLYLVNAGGPVFDSRWYAKFYLYNNIIYFYCILLIFRQYIVWAKTS